MKDIGEECGQSEQDSDYVQPHRGVNLLALLAIEKANCNRTAASPMAATTMTAMGL